jgi:CDP-glucose 4,6-dehydratase
VLEITRAILRLMNREDLEPQILNEVKGEIPHQYLSAQKARRQLGWEGHYTIETGLAESIAWYRDYFDRQRAA